MSPLCIGQHCVCVASMQWVWQKLPHVNERRTKDLLINVMATGLYYNASLTVTYLQQQQQLLPFLTIWAKVGLQSHSPAKLADVCLVHFQVIRPRLVCTCVRPGLYMMQSTIKSRFFMDRLFPKCPLATSRPCIPRLVSAAALSLHGRLRGLGSILQQNQQVDSAQAQ